MNYRALSVAVCTLLAGLALFVWGTGVVRGTGGDVGIMVLLVAALATVGLGTPRRRLIAVGAFGVTAECVQGLDLVGPDAHWLLHLTVGSTFDPFDFVAYAVGLGVAAALEQWWAPIGSQTVRA